MVLSKSVLCILVAGFLLPGCVTAGKYYQLEDELARAREELAYAQDNLADAEALLTQVDSRAGEAERLAAELEAARREKEALQRQMDSLGLQKSELDKHGLSMVTNDEGMVGYAAKGDVVFSSGSDVVTSEGAKALKYIADQLKANDYAVRVDGHTDTDPIVKTKDKFGGGNIHLGAMRAIAVRAKLVELGIAEDRISIASYGQFKPAVSGSDNASKSRNRRVEIMMKVAGQGN